jgi:hypothetical protein
MLFSLKDIDPEYRQESSPVDENKDAVSGPNKNSSYKYLILATNFLECNFRSDRVFVIELLKRQSRTNIDSCSHPDI